MRQTHPKMTWTAVRVALLAVLLLTCTVTAFAQTQGQMNRTASQAAQTADAAMNARYKKLMTVLNPTEKAALKKAQQAWLKYRDAEAEFLSLRSQGGSVHPMVYAQNVAGLTRQRTQELTEAYTEYTTEGDL